MSGQLAGKVAIVTGAASGIGRAAALLFAAEGARVALVDRDASALAATLAEIGHGPAANAGVQALDLDVTDARAVAIAAGRIVAEWGRIDVLLTAAGISGSGAAAADTAEEDWDRILAVNAKGTFLWIKAVLPHMTRGGSIVTVASQLARAGGRANAAYVASKGAVISLTRSVALDYAAQGIRANVLLPGATDTPMLQRSFSRRADPDAAREASRRRHPLGRFATAEEVARAALYLASDAAAFVTGAELPVEGGWLVA
jgi:NAD(P)-dependent dehydrogenase (short-subunit alcohol dehydrogenase family)